MRKTVLAWHWLLESRKLQFAPYTAVEAGQELQHEGPLELCSSGLHASERLIDALRYAPGRVLCRVQLSGEVLRGGDKLCGSRRKVLWMVDAAPALREFAWRCAERALLREREAGREPHPDSWAAVQAAKDYAAGKITAGELKRARDSAMGIAITSTQGFNPLSSAAHSADFAARSAGANSSYYSGLPVINSNFSYSKEKEWQNRLLIRLVNKLRKER